MAEFVNRLNECLNDISINKSEVARRASISRQALNGYISGRTHPAKNIVESLANVFNVNPAWLDGYDVPKYQNLKANNQKSVDLDDEDAIFTYEGRKIPKEDIELMKRLLRGKKEN